MSYTSSILLIGGGNMGTALAGRWQETFADTQIVIAETNAEKRAALTAQGFHAPDELEIPEEGFDLVVLAIKPQTFPTLAPSLSSFIGEATLVSIMAGVPLAALQHITPHAARVMPNTPALIGEAMSAICAPDLSEERLNAVKELFGVVGHTVVLTEEEQMHAVTAISGSGPAYVFAFMEAMEQAAIGLGLDATTARALVTQTVRGAALLADQEGGDAARLRVQVTSPGGTTQAALESFTSGKLYELVMQATQAAASRSKALSA